MRLLGRLFFLMLTAAVIGMIVRSYLPGLLELTQKIESSLVDSKASTFYFVDDTKWLSYTVAPADKRFRFYFHAGLISNNHDAPVPFNIEYQWLNSDGELMEEGNYALAVRSSHLLAIDQTNDFAGDNSEPELVPSRFYADRKSFPSNEQTVYLPVPSNTQPAELRMKLASKSPSVEFVGVRSYHRNYRDKASLQTTWQRMSEKRREALAEASFYPMPLLSKFERDNLLSAFWKSLGPKGVIGDDFEQGTLYIREVGEPWQLPQEEILDGHFGAASSTITFILAEEGQYQLSMTPVKNAGKLSALIAWQGVDYQQSWQEQTAPDKTVWEGQIQPGILSWTPTVAATVKLFKHDGSQWVDITPARRFSKRYICDRSLPLQYSLAKGKETQPLRIVAQQFYHAELQNRANGSFQVRYRLQDQQGDELFSSAFETPDKPDVFRQFADSHKAESLLYEPAQAFVNAPPKASTLIVQCDRPTLIALYTRPAALPVLRSYPRDNNPWVDHEDRVPTWFSMRPDLPNDQKGEARDVRIVWYHHPVTLNEAVAEGDYLWQGLRAKDTYAIEKQLLTPANVNTTNRREALGSAFSPVIKGSKTFAGQFDQQLFKPEVIFLRENPEKTSATIYVDKQRHHHALIQGYTGKIPLPPISAGRHSIEIKADKNIRWFINHSLADNQPFLLRSAYWVDQKKIDFELPTNGENQTLSFWFYLPQHLAETPPMLSCQVAMTLKQAATVAEARTLPNYQFHFSEQAPSFAYGLQGRYLRYAGPMKALIHLKNIPPQSGSLSLKCNKSEWLVSVGLISQGALEYSLYEEIYE